MCRICIPTGNRIVPPTDDRLSAGTFSELLSLAKGNSTFKRGTDGSMVTSLIRGLARGGWSWGQSIFDANNDGRWDVYVVNGNASHRDARAPDYSTYFWRQLVAHAAETEGPKKRQAFESPKDLKEAADFWGSFSGYESNRFFLNGGVGKPFIEAGYPCGLAAQTDGRAVAAFDLEGDGYPDLAVLSLQGFKVYRNQLRSGAAHFLDLALKDKFGGPALGARIQVDAGGRSVVDRSRLTMGFHTQVMNRAHFGLGDAQTVESIRVHWPSGAIQKWTGLQGNRRYQLEEGNKHPIEIPIHTWKPAVMPVVHGKLTVSSIQARTLDGKSTSIASSSRPTVVNIWAPWCTRVLLKHPN